ncbi:hypothetical protein CYLTODRAFT_488498 [Cylindrobasidium torrendii FP15055 ss-10]|uniref:Extracellular membrane protein CFEM domain-containing protein n=1 Tax=Cylindrobasidium torrendii FP15055 ss-10 TaxID=1314674 RepID=A0A0D7BI40_9AGAR|nr:hypothetical protein CYLTODRAFT_488498 [Cylindrobasidium torrendii FP15055 ss-10]
MKLLFSSIIGFGLLRASVTANTVYAREAALPLEAFNTVIPPPSIISARQFNDSTPLVDSMPQQCRDRCSVLDDMAACSDASCVCTEDKSKHYADCMNCVLATDGTDAHEDVLQHTYDLFKSACESGGHSVPEADIGADSGDSDGAMHIGGTGASMLLAFVFVVLGASSV